ncbi:MAG: DedA family protein [Geobacteraceae bacterium]|nr:DedA family protein [Geobacteraceae bacterium]
MHETLAAYGIPALFVLSFLASTMLPLGSEWLLVALLIQKHDPVLSVTVATVGNYLGACTSYFIGIYGGDFLVKKMLRIDDSERARAERFFAKYGSWSLFFSWLPVVGDPLCLVGGLLRIPFTRFSILVASGKAIRYSAVAWLTLKGVQSVAT